jgi:3',5'-cyclic AMP phosphodiesterase CpdA
MKKKAAMTNVTRRTFLKSSLASAGLLLMGTGTAAGAARLTIKHPRRFRILQLTDLHFFSHEKELRDAFNARAAENMHKLVKATKPDLVVVTGDVWSENPEGMGEAWMRFAIGHFEALGVPWAFAWGNHDQVSDFSAAHDALTHGKNSLYRGGDADGNYVIVVEDKDRKRVWQIVCLNSHRDGLQQDQRQWVEYMVKTDPGPVPRFAFFHIPLRQYDEIWKNGAVSGMKGEDVCMEKEDGSTLAVLKAAGVRACFCGHDHQNDYSGMANGVELVYGRVSRAGGYGADIFPKGGKLITVNCRSGSYDWVSVTPDGKRWHAKPGEHREIPN